MNDICKENTAKKFEVAFRKEHLSKGEAGKCIGLTAVQVSYLFNKNYWNRLGSNFDKVLSWVNSGYSLKEYPKHRPDAVLKDVAEKKIIDPVASALWNESVEEVRQQEEKEKADEIPRDHMKDLREDRSLTEEEKIERFTGSHFKKPPLGIMPQKLWDETRLRDIGEAMGRFSEKNTIVPKDWFDEYDEICNRWNLR